MISTRRGAPIHEVSIKPTNQKENDAELLDKQQDEASNYIKTQQHAQLLDILNFQFEDLAINENSTI